jgi:hypothetical protein
VSRFRWGANRGHCRCVRHLDEPTGLQARIQRGKAFDPELLDGFFLAPFEILRTMDLYADERGSVADVA